MKELKTFTFLIMVVFLLLAIGCADSSDCDDSSGVPEEITDSRDGQVYQTVKIGGQTWLAQNLNYQTENSWCYNDDPANCEIYGRLYDWEAARTACPEGWHLSTDEDWTTLITYIDPQTDLDAIEISSFAGGMIKTTGIIEDGTGLWDAPNKGATNRSGFSAVPAGSRFEDGVYMVIGMHAIFWTATENDDDLIWFTTLDYGLLSIYRILEGEWMMTRDNGNSVRCVNDIVTEVCEPFDSIDPEDKPDLSNLTDPKPVFGEMTDDRDDQTYKTVTLGDQIWLAENVNYVTENSWCYDDVPANCDIYGRMYTWDAAMEACPDGWNPGSKEDWTALSTYLDPDTVEPSDKNMDISPVAGEMLKADENIWPTPDNEATNLSGFSVLPAGTLYEGLSSVLGYITMIWTASETNEDYAWTLMLDGGQMGFYLDDTATTKDYALSVRCIEE